MFALIRREEDKKYLPEVEKWVNEVRVFKKTSRPFTLENLIRTALSSKPLVMNRNRAKGLPEAVVKRLEQSDIDLVHIESFYLMPNLPETLPVPVVLAEQTVEYLAYESYAKDSGRKLLKPFLYADVNKIKKWERHFWLKSDRVVAVSSEDKSLIERLEPKVKPVGVVANGVDVDYFDATGKKLPKEPTVLFVGNYSWLPNVQAVKYLVEKVWPRILKAKPEAKLLIAGYRPTKEILSYKRIKGIKVLGPVEDVREVYKKSHLLLAPVFWGKGTRLKVLEAMASKTPVVSTPEAIEGISGIEAGRHVLVGENPESLARQTVRLLGDQKLQKEIADRSYHLVKENYHWQAIAADLDRVYREAAKK